MNLNGSKKSAAAWQWPAWLFVAVYLFMCSPARAEIEGRWLLVFDTSAAMKKRLPGLDAALKTFLGKSGGGQIHAGDSVGVWTFCRQLHTGEFPLTTWMPERSAMTASNMVKFVRHQWFAGDTSLDALQPSLEKIIADSDRLTVLIFCDGNSQMDWTPYDNGINQTFRQNFAERQKSRQPFVVLLRTQQGKFTGCTVNFPPGEITLPPFPPWPESPVPVVSTATERPSAPVSKPPAVAVPSLIIVGTNVGTNVEELKKIADQRPPTPASNLVSTPLSSGASAVSNPPPPDISAVKQSAPTNAVAKTLTPASNAPAPNNAARPAKGPNRLLFTVGCVLLLAVLVLALLSVMRSRRPRNSLITDSLNAPKVPPRKK